MYISYNKNIFLENQQRIKVYSRKMNNIENAIKNCEINYRFENDKIIINKQKNERIRNHAPKQICIPQKTFK